MVVMKREHKVLSIDYGRFGVERQALYLSNDADGRLFFCLFSKTCGYLSRSVFTCWCVRTRTHRTELENLQEVDTV